ncbi:hypothetical protein CRG98_025782 [Punica granatum]|uniref:Reverse transcriptase Ty1/copia-type domain-containing protein n=1 Tax=Punica granatum TaxID=22663 RepID=A0A2I0JCU3_PUNGR|nr:hypothetical protein CRG98_025782 [Punica granatum]
MKSEMDSMSKNQVWDLVDPPEGIILIGNKWVFKRKIGVDGKMDVKTAFLNGDIEEDIFMDQPKGFEFNNKSKVCKLKRSIYGLKQASRSWNRRFDEAVKSFGFIKNEDEACVYKKASWSMIAFLVLYVDDILLIGNDVGMLTYVKSDVDDRKFISGYIFTCNGGAVSWKSSKQETTVYSIIVAEYIAASDVAKEAV